MPMPYLYVNYTSAERRRDHDEGIRDIQIRVREMEAAGLSILCVGCGLRGIAKGSSPRRTRSTTEVHGGLFPVTPAALDAV